MPFLDSFFPLFFGGKLNKVQNKIKSISKKTKTNKTLTSSPPVVYLFILNAVSYCSVKQINKTDKASPGGPTFQSLL